MILYYSLHFYILPFSSGDVVSPASTAAITGLSADFGLAPDAPEAERRLKLAEWVTHQDNALFARVIANRVWHYHFGAGIVDTPNDFGFNGGRPSHPELLEYLARRLTCRSFASPSRLARREPPPVP